MEWMACCISINWRQWDWAALTCRHAWSGGKQRERRGRQAHTPTEMQQFERNTGKCLFLEWFR